MPMEVSGHGICRFLSPVPNTTTVGLAPTPDYSRRSPQLQAPDGRVSIDGRWWVQGSHALEVEGQLVRMVLPKGEAGWMVLLEEPHASLDGELLQEWLTTTLNAWRKVASRITYHGPYEAQVMSSLRALRLLTFSDNGGVIAAATTSLPEIIGGSRNYDYRYVWLRDTGMIISALLRAGSDGEDALRFLAFLCGSAEDTPERPPIPPFLTLDQEPAPREQHLDLPGFLRSRPVRVGNGANRQWQLDGYGNILLAAKLLYGRIDTRDHWPVVEQIAEFLTAGWREPDFGIWEETQAQQYTLGKVVAACGLEYIADFATDKKKADAWREEAGRIREYVARECLTSGGAYAVRVGSEAVDVSAVLIPIWGYEAADTPAMLATLSVLKQKYSEDDLYWRHLEDTDSRKEGAFLAGTIWIAQYWIMRGDLNRATQILDAALKYSNDLGLFAEEAEPVSQYMLGNFPQAFVHAAFIGAVVDLRDALSGDQ
jgi:GH15 family glucan-1,4-alpha-glucosidase